MIGKLDPVAKVVPPEFSAKLAVSPQLAVIGYVEPVDNTVPPDSAFSAYDAVNVYDDVIAWLADIANDATGGG